MDDLQRTVDLRERLAVGVGLQEGDVAAGLAELGDPVPHRRQDEVGLLPVEGATTEHGARLDDQQGPVMVVDEVRSQLVGEQPARRGLTFTRSPTAAERRNRNVSHCVLRGVSGECAHECAAKYRRQEPVTAWSRRLSDASSCSAETSGKLTFLSSSGSVTLLQS